MSDIRPGPPNALETTRIRGGASARMGAIALAGILGVVAWIGISGRPPIVAAPSPGPQVAQAPSSLESATAEATATAEPTISPTRTPPPAGDPPPGSANAGFDRYSVVATIGHEQYISKVVQADQGHISFELEVPIPPPATHGTLELAQVWPTVSHDAWHRLAKWDLRLESLSAASGREYIVLDRSVPARRTLPNVPPPVTNGYRITVRAQSGIPRALLRIDIRVGPNRQLVGDDGIFGWPVVAPLIEAPVDGPAKINGCRWNGRPPPSRRPPLPTYDEASC